MAATQSLKARTRATCFSHITLKILGAAALATGLMTAAVRAEQIAPAIDIDPIFASSRASQPVQLDVEVPTAPVSHPLAPLSAAGVVAGASMQSASLIATGPVAVSAAFQPQHRSSPFRLLRSALADASPSQIRLLAATIFAEARSEGVRGMRAVAHVIQNRVGPRFGRSMAEVILKPWQFSAWNRGDPNRKIALDPERHARSADDREAWAAAQTIAREVLEGRSVDPTGGALFYHTLAIKPHWASAGVGRRVIGQHIFYRDVRG